MAFRFLEPSVSRTSRYLEPNLVSLGFASLELYNFTPDFSNPRFLETSDNSNQFFLPWDKLTLDNSNLRKFRKNLVRMSIDLFTDTAAILISIVSNSHYGMPRGQIHINLPPGHPIMSFETIEIKMAAVSVKRSIISTPLNKLTLPDKLFSHILITQQASHKSVISLKGTMIASDYRTKVHSFNCFSEAVAAIHR